MADTRALVGNAADREQVQRASRKTHDRRALEIADLREVLSTRAGSRTLWRLLEHCKTFESIWDPSVRIHVNAGRQDVGHWLMAEIEQADDAALFRLMQDARARAKREANENEAAQTPRAVMEG